MKISAIFNDALPIISKFAPSIGTALGGPIGFATGYILPILAKAFNANPQNLSELVNNIISDPDSQTKLESIEHEHGDWLCTTLDSIGNLAEAEISVKLKWQTEKS